jgi:hypothetical protein
MDYIFLLPNKVYLLALMNLLMYSLVHWKTRNFIISWAPVSLSSMNCSVQSDHHFQSKMADPFGLRDRLFLWVILRRFSVYKIMYSVIWQDGWWIMNWKGSWHKRGTMWVFAWRDWGKLRETSGSAHLDNRSPEWDWNWASPEFKPRLLLLEHSAWLEEVFQT